MDNYYKLLEVNYNDSTEIIINVCKRKLFEYKALPYLTNEDKNIIKQLKKSYYIFNNPEIKKKYDEIYLKNFNNNNLEFNNNNLENNLENKLINDPIRNKHTIDIRSNKKNPKNQNYLVDRIFSFQNSNNSNNLKNNELLRPKNAGLSSDEIIEFNKPIDYNESSEFLPYNFDS